MENWRKFEIGAEFSTNSDRLEEAILKDYSYITNTLGIKLQLDESKTPIISESLREQILAEHMLFEGFFDRFNPINAIKKYGQEIGNLFSSLYRLIKEPKFIPHYVNALGRKIIRPFTTSLEALISWLESNQMPTFASGIKKIISGIKKIYDLAGWKQALAITGAVIGLHYIKNKLGDLLGADVVGSKTGDSVLETISKQAWNAAENFLMKEFPKLAAKLYGTAALAASSGFLGWMLGAAGILKVVNFAKDALKGALGQFKRKVARAKRREAAAGDGSGPVLNRGTEY
tara:strand:- start:11656 stop:12519 length:864 start_codon:yes stop_codon:yes gene_type:complete